MANIVNWLDASTIANLPALDIFANLYYYSSSLMTSTLDSELRHRWQAQIVQHEVHIRCAQSRGVEPDQQIVILCKPSDGALVLSLHYLLHSGTSNSWTSR